MAQTRAAYVCRNGSCQDHSVLTPGPWGIKSGADVLCRECREPMNKVRLSEEQKRAIEGYEFALREEDRYLGSVFVNRVGQERIEAKTAAAHERAKRLGVSRWC